jgi:hypothetical protein
LVVIVGTHVKCTYEKIYGYRKQLYFRIMYLKPGNFSDPRKIALVTGHLLLIFNFVLLNLFTNTALMVAMKDLRIFL